MSHFQRLKHKIESREAVAARGARLSYSDPYVANLNSHGQDLASIPLSESCRQADCTVIVTDHDCFDYATIVSASRLIVDTRDALKNFQSPSILPH